MRQAIAGLLSGRPTRSSWELLAWVLLGVGALVFLQRAGLHRGSFAEDAYISFRYATNLAEGAGLVWNVGGERVEGYTSPLHIFLLATGFSLGGSPGALNLLLGYLPVAGVIAAAVAFVRREAGTLTPAAALVLWVYLCEDRLAVHATAGLDTALYLALLAWSFVLSARLLRAPSAGSAAALAAIDFACLLGRPDAAPFVATQAVVLLVAGMRRALADPAPPGSDSPDASDSMASSGSEPRALLRWALVGYGSLGVVGITYLGWKLWYFGYLLPNPYYIKSNALFLAGFDHVADYLGFLPHRYGWAMVVLLPLVDYRACRDWLRRPAAGGTLALLLAPPAVFLAYYGTVMHEVCYLHRFEYPSYAALAMAAALFFAVGRPVERAFELVSARIPAPRIAVLALVGAVLAALVLQTYRATRIHFPWFARVEQGYYRPVGEALASTGLEWDATLVLDSAGVVPFTSRFTHIDPVGLNDNTLSGREPISAFEREAYIWGRNPDVYIGPEPPASPGVAGCASESLFRTGYGREVLLRPIASGPYQRIYGELPADERCEAVHRRMRELRDRFTLLGEIPFPVPVPPLYTTFAFVRSDSRHYDALTDALTPLIARGPGQTDFESAER